MAHIKRQFQIQDDGEDDQSPEWKRTRHSEVEETHAGSDVNAQNQEGHIDAIPEYEDDDQPLVRRRHIVGTSPSTAGAGIADGVEETDHVHGARGGEDNDAIANQKPSVKSEASNSIQWPLLLAESEMPSPADALRSREKSMAKKKELASRGLKESTIYSYSPYLVRWETFCDKFYRGDYAITSDKVLHFFNVDLFVGKPTVIKVEEKRNVPIGWTKHDPILYPAEAEAEAALIRQRFETAMSQPNIVEQYFMLPPTGSTVLTAICALSCEDSYRSGQTTQAPKPTSAREVRNAINVYTRSLVYRSANEGVRSKTKGQGGSSTKVQNAAQSSQQEVVPGKSQQVAQSTRRVPITRAKAALPAAVKPVPAPVSKPAAKPTAKPVAKPVATSVAKPVPAVGDKTATNSISKIVDNDFTRTMIAFFERRTAVHGTHSPGIRNRAIFALERELLVPCQDLLNLDLIDSFTEHFDITHKGSTTKVPGLAICVRYEQPLPAQDSPVVVVLRHKDYRSCAVGALAFHFFDRFQLRGEPFPDFTNVNEWPLIKLLRNKDILEPTSLRAVEEAIRFTVTEAGVQDRALAQSAGAIKELAGLGIRIEGPRKMGPNGETPRGLTALAGFHNEPYNLARDVLPPLQLQRTIFPMIESQHGSMDPVRWKAHCDVIMKDPSASPGMGLKQGDARSRRFEAVQESTDEYLGVARLDLLHLLLWMRRVVLQDMALFIREKSRNDLVRHEIFESPEFATFQKILLEKLEGQMSMSSQDQVFASGSHSVVQHDQRDSGASSKVPASQQQSERRYSGVHQRLSDEHSQEGGASLNSAPAGSDKGVQNEGLDDGLGADQGLQQLIDRDRRQQQQSHKSLSDLFLREQDWQQKSHERELRRVQQDHAQEKAYLEGRIVRIEQKLQQQSEQLRSVRQRMVRQEEYIKDLEKDQRREMLELECQLATQADQIALQEERLQLLEEDRDDRRQGKRTQTLRGLDQRSTDRQLPGTPSFGGRRGSMQMGRDVEVAAGSRTAPKARLDGVARRLLEAISLIEEEREV